MFFTPTASELRHTPISMQFAGATMNYQNILVETHDHVGLIILNRPNVLNALSDDLMDEVGDAVDKFEADNSIGALVVTGNDKAFAAGADIKRMKDSTYMDVYMGNLISRNWDCLL